MKTQKVVVGLSGGVDSSVAAYLLKEAGYQVIGIFMKNWDDTNDPECPAAKDFEDVARVAEQLDIPYYAVDFSQEYWNRVFVDFLDAYKRGYTPNPDILCNREIKFSVFYDQAMSLGADALATGHYVRLENNHLYRALDLTKDQSYFLYTLNQKLFPKLRFPLGSLTKLEVRQIARRLNLSTAEKKDSTGICFVGQHKMRPFLKKYLQDSAGPILNVEGKQVGTHEGLHFYTLGQRKGLSIAAQSGALHNPWFVVGKHLKNNALIVQQGVDPEALYAKKCTIEAVHWIHESLSYEMPLRCLAKARYRMEPKYCLIEPHEKGFLVTFDEPQRALTPGQSLVFYQGELVLGGAVIESVLDSPALVRERILHVLQE